MIHYRQAEWNDLEPLLDLIERGFSVKMDSVADSIQGKEHRVLFSYLYSKSNWEPKLVYLAVESGRPVAAVGFFPQRLFFENVELSVWAVSPVVTDPDYRGKGYAGTCLIQALKELENQDVQAVFLWGLPSYYPRFGFVPILPRYKTKLPVGALAGEGKTTGCFRTVKPEDLPQLAALYDQGNYTYWLQPRRNLQWWRERLGEMDIMDASLKEVPFPKKENFLVWENNKKNVAGYVNYFKVEGQEININDAATSDIGTATEMISAFVTRLNSQSGIYLRGTPEHPLNAAAYRLGGIHLNPAPRAGMIKIINWPKFIQKLLPVVTDRARILTGIKNGAGYEFDGGIYRFRLLWDDLNGFEIRDSDRYSGAPENEKSLTRLFLGLYDQADLNNVSGLDFKTISKLFPLKTPFIWDNNYLY